MNEEQSDKWHVHPEKGALKCNVGKGKTGRIRGCPFGDLQRDHYSTKREAQVVFERRNNEKYGGAKVVVALDLDNTVVDFTSGFRSYMAKRDGISYVEALEKYPNPTNYNFAAGETPWFSSTKEFVSALQDAERKGLYKNLRQMTGSLRVVRMMLKDPRIDVRVVTARSEAYHEDTLENLRKLNLPINDVEHLEDKVNYPAHVFIDDKDSFADAIQKGDYEMDGRPKEVIVPFAEYNSHLETEKSWNDIKNKLNELVDRRLGS